MIPPQQRPAFVGVDSGGTQTRAVIVDAHGRALGRGAAGGANPQSVGFEPAAAQVWAAAAQAAANAGLILPLTGAWCGLAGVDRPGDYAALAPRLGALAGAVRLTNDAELGLAALPDGCGVCVIAGTGSIALGCDRRGTAARAGGWGHLLGDEGSGYDLSRQALRAVACAADGRGPATALTAAVLRAWRLDTPAALVDRLYPTAEPASVATLAAVVCATAAAGDAVARRIVAAGATALAGAVLAVAARLAWPGPVPLALAGGVLCGQPAYRAAVVRRVRRHCAVAPVVTVPDPALAAARAAARATPLGPVPRGGRTAPAHLAE